MHPVLLRRVIESRTESAELALKCGLTPAK